MFIFSYFQVVWEGSECEVYYVYYQRNLNEHWKQVTVLPLLALMFPNPDAG